MNISPEQVAESFEKLNKSILALSGMTNPCGEVILIDSLTQKVMMKPPKHPNRPKKKDPVKVRDLEARMFAHLKKGRLYKLSIQRSPFPGSEYLYKQPFLGPDYRINTVETGQVVMYLDTVGSGHGTFHKVIYGDQVGYVRQGGYTRLKKVTKRELDRNEKRLLGCQQESNETR